MDNGKDSISAGFELKKERLSTMLAQRIRLLSGLKKQLLNK